MMKIDDMRPHDLLCDLLANNAEDAIRYQGYIAHTGKDHKIGDRTLNEDEFTIWEDDKILLYPDIFDLSKSFEIKKSDILVCTKAPESFLPFNGGVILWLKKNSEVIYRQTEKPTGTNGINRFPETGDDETIVVTSGRIVITIPGSIKKYVPPPGKGPCNHKGQ